MASPIEDFEPNRLEVLKTMYSRQQDTAFKNRERMTQIAAAHITLLLAIDGWVLTGDRALNSSQQLLVILAVALTCIIALFAIRSRYREFSTVGGMIVRIETALRVFDRGYYLADETLYDLEHQNLGKDDYAHSMSIFQSHFYALVANSALTAGIVLTS